MFLNEDKALVPDPNLVTTALHPNLLTTALHQNLTTNSTITAPIPCPTRGELMKLAYCDDFEINRDNGLLAIFNHKRASIERLLKVKVNYSSNTHTALKKGVKTMRNKVVETCGCLFLDLHNIIFGYLLWC